MPPIGQQGSRAALVTWVVVLAILFITATIFAFYGFAEAKQQEKLVVDTKNKTKDYVSEADVNDAKVNDLKELRNQEGGAGFNLNRQMSALDVAIAQRDKLAEVITGRAGAKPAEAVDEARRSLTTAADAVKPLGFAVPNQGSNLTGAVSALSGAAVNKQNEVNTLNAQVKSSEDKVKEVTKNLEDMTAAKDKQIADIRAEADKTVADTTADRQAKQEQIEGVEKDRTKESQTYAEATSKVQATLAERDRKIGDLEKQLKTLRDRLANNRVNPNGPVLRQADGSIIRLPGNNTCYINLGAGDQVSPGLTFEVYDKNEGVPALDDKNEDSLPEGKASIEVTRVGATSSECRIVHTKPGTTLTEGDLISNLIYDPHTKYTFLVYGNFDMDQNGIATPADADVVKRLITQWGGRLSDKVTVDTDFVVLGKEPVIPTFTKEELEDAVNQKKVDDAKAELEAYMKVRGEASDLHIPILNQNRFLYFIGYFDQSKR